MQTIQELYQGTISQLPLEQRLQLASLILNDLAVANREEKLSAVALLKSFPRGRGFRNTEEVDVYLAEEHDSWDR